MIACKCEVCCSRNKKDNRLRSSILIRSEQVSVVVDTTPDFRYQMLRSAVDHLDAVVFTHSHKDHVGGLDDIRAYNFFSQRPKPSHVGHAPIGLLKENVRGSGSG